MKRIVLSYDPYLMKTTMEVDGAAVTEGRFWNYIKADVPLQSWIVPIPAVDWKGFLFELKDKYGDNRFDIEFRGRRLDLEDFKATIERQIADSRQAETPLDANITEKIVLDDDSVGKTIRKAVKKIQSSEFAEILHDPLINATPMLKKAHETLEADYKAARDKEFHVVFAGTVSSGKSTLLNALVRKRILPSGDGTCTSKVFYIHHAKGVDFAEMLCRDSGNRIVVKRETYADEAALRAKFSELFPAGEKGELSPSVPPTIDSVHIYTDLRHLYPDGFENKFNLVLVDTPGTNSHLGNDEEEQDVPHVEITKKIIRSREQAMVVLVIDDDDGTDENASGLLETINDAVAGGTAYAQRFLFAANKYDDVDYGENETLGNKVSQVSLVIQDGAKDLLAPRVFPLAAKVALAIYTGTTDRKKGTSKEEVALAKTFDDFQSSLDSGYPEDYYLDEYCSVSQPIKNHIQARLEKADEVERVLIHSGVPSLEAAIQDYIQRYAYPLKVRTLYKTFQSILAETGGFLSALSSALEQKNQELENANVAKKEKNEERDDAQKRKKRLENVKRIIDQRVDQVEQYKLDEAHYQDLLSTARAEIYGSSDFGEIVNEAAKLHEGQLELKNLQKKLAKRFERAMKDMNAALNTWVKGELAAIQNLMQGTQETLEELKRDGLLNFGAYDFSRGVVVNELKGAIETWSDEWLVKETIRNPEKDKKLHFWQIFKKLDRLWEPDVLERYRLDEDRIRSERDVLEKQFRKNCKEARENIENRLAGAKEQAKGWLDSLLKALDETQSNLQTMKEAVQKLSKDGLELKRAIAQTEKQKKFLENINQMLEQGVAPEPDKEDEANDEEV